MNLVQRPTRSRTILGLASTIAVWIACIDALETNPGQQNTGTTESDFFRDVSETNLPTGTLTGLSMDAGVADVDGDGDLDIVVASEFARNILLINDGSGNFTDQSSNLPAANRDSEDVGIADFDGDGDLDIVIVSEDDQVNEFYLNVGDGFFTDETSARLPSNSDRSFEGDFVDIDGDGDLDIITGNSNGSTATPYRAYLNDGTGIFIDGTGDVLPVTAVGSGFDVEAADFNTDGLLELFLASRGSLDLLLLGRGYSWA